MTLSCEIRFRMIFLFGCDKCKKRNKQVWRSKMKSKLIRFLGLLVIFNLALGILLARDSEGEKSKVRKRASEKFKIIAKPWGPTQKNAEAAKLRVERSSALRNALGGKKFRMVDFEVIERTDSNKNSLIPTHYRVYYYDYTNGKTFIAESDFARREPITIKETDFEPNVSVTQEEIEAGFELIKNNSKLSSMVRANKIELYAPMPPLTYKDGERLVNIGIRYKETGKNEIVGISFKDDKVIFYDKNAAPNAGATTGNCGFTNSGQGSSSSGTGQLQITTELNGSNLWEMTVVRPAESSGRPGEGSGIEVRDVKYKGKMVLKRGHAPILNVKYHPGGCGSFRDWQDSEGFFNAPETGSQNPADGFRVLADGEVATTIVETSNDTGNFRGVAVYQQDNGYGNELVLVSEMNAGWYRYIMEWRFANDGTIRPRYGFGSVSNGCVCRARNHHVYWRFDFDIVNANNNVYKVERGRKFLTQITTESKIFRSYQTNRSILIQNASGDEAYQLTPNITDEEAYNYEGNVLQTFGAGDLWIMQFKGTSSSPNELDDPNSGRAANLDPWVNGESIGNNDAVIWYGAHQFRDDASSLTNFDRSGLTLNGVHTVGPDLRPVRW